MNLNLRGYKLVYRDDKHGATGTCLKTCTQFKNKAYRSSAVTKLFEVPLAMAQSGSRRRPGGYTCTRTTAAWVPVPVAKPTKCS